MLYLLLVACIAVLGLMLLNVQQKNKKSDSNEMQLVQCARCNTYITKGEAHMKNGVIHCTDCLKE